MFVLAGGVDSGIDLLESLQLHNTSRQGVSTMPGPQRLRPAFYLQGKWLIFFNVFIFTNVF